MSNENATQGSCIVGRNIGLLWQAITPLHIGTGQDGAGLVDLPVAREAATGFPVLPASGIKGSFRDGDHTSELAKQRFGTTDAQGRLTFTDARLFALAVPSFTGTFALVTCPMVLHRYSRDRARLVPGATRFAPVAVAEDKIAAPDRLVSGDHVQLQDYRLSRVPVDDACRSLFEQVLSGVPEQDRQVVRERLCVVSDEVFAFLCETSLDVSPHVRLEEASKTVADGALWWEECIPAESLLTSFVLCRRAEDVALFQEPALRRIGGKETVGRGLAQLTMMEEQR